MPRSNHNGEVHTNHTSGTIQLMVPLLALAALLFVIPVFTTAGAQFLSNTPVRPLPNSRLWFEGSTTISTYECEASEIEGVGYIKSASDLNGDRQTEAKVEVTVPVKQLDCGKKGMNQDMYKALQASSFPQIHYELVSTQQVQTDMEDQKEWIAARTVGRLTIAGTTRKVDIEVRGRRKSDNVLQVRGRKKLNMESYGVQPPTALFGLVQAHKELTVHFDLLVAPSDTNSHATADTQ